MLIQETLLSHKYLHFLIDFYRLLAKDTNYSHHHEHQLLNV